MLNRKKNEYKKNFIGIILLGIVLRFLLLLVIGTDKQNDWEYGIIAENIVNGKGYSFYYIEDGRIIHDIKKDTNPAPSAYMAPGYVYVIVLVKYISSPPIENFVAFGFNLLFYIATMFYLFKVALTIFNNKIAFISIIIYAIIPEFIYSTYSLGTTQIYHLLLIAIVYYSLKETNSKMLLLPVLFGIALLFRFELFILLVLAALLMFYRKKFTQVLLILIIPTMFISPWIIRNYQTFDEFIPFSTTGGLNLFRGNNDIVIGGWHNFNTLEIISEFDGDTNKVELFLNNMYKNEALNYITDDISVSGINFIQKLFYYWFLNPIEEKSLNPIYFIPWFLMLSLAIMGFMKKKKIPTIVIIVISFHTLLAVVFIPLLRYQSMMKIVLIPFVAYGIIELLKKDK